MHLPDFSGSRFQAALRATENASGAKCADRQLTADASPSAILARARERFGSRFFVAPHSVSPLWRRLGDEFPQWRERLVEVERADVNAGIRIYSGRGPRISREFPWDRLSTGPGEDNLYVKHLQRFGFAPRHALACHHDPNAVDRLQSILEEWMACAEAGRNRWCYDSNLVVIQRLFALSWVWVFVAGAVDSVNAEVTTLEWRTLQIIEADIRFLECRLGRSAPNNHLLTDRFAAWYIHAIFPELLTDPDEKHAESGFRDEILRQTYADGGSFEHSMHYHESVCEMVAAYLILCRRQGRRPDLQLKERARALLCFQAVTSGPDAIPLPLGNGTEDPLFPLDPESGWCSGALREIYRVLFNPRIPSAPIDDATIMRAYWLLGGELERQQIDNSNDQRLVPFEATGVYVFTDAVQNARLVFRTGPSPDVQVSPGHMHADMLSVYLQANNKPMIVDAGTYTYRFIANQETTQVVPWRSYLAGPAAHNGLSIGQEDPLGAFHADFRRTDGQLRVNTHYRMGDGLSLVDASIVWGGLYTNARRICAHICGEYWLLVDVHPKGEEENTIAHYGFQFAAGTKVNVSSEKTTIRNPGDHKALTLIGDKGRMAPSLLEGSMNPLGGWVSPRYGELKKAPQVRFPIRTGDSVSAFLLRLECDNRQPRTVEVVRVAHGVIGVHIKTPDTDDLVLYDDNSSGDRELHYDGIVFRGGVLWLRRRDLEIVEYREINADGVWVKDNDKQSNL